MYMTCMMIDDHDERDVNNTKENFSGRNLTSVYISSIRTGFMFIF
jgi:hypothetical protein